jgi:hypothetical protein
VTAVEAPTLVMRMTLNAIATALTELGRDAATGDPELTSRVAEILGVTFRDAEARIRAVDDWAHMVSERGS